MSGLLQGPLGKFDHAKADGVGLGRIVEIHQSFVDQRLEQVEAGAGVQFQVARDAGRADG